MIAMHAPDATSTAVQAMVKGHRKHMHEDVLSAQEGTSGSSTVSTLATFAMGTCAQWSLDLSLDLQCLPCTHGPDHASGAVQVMVKGHCNHWNKCESTGKHKQQHFRTIDKVPKLQCVPWIHVPHDASGAVHVMVKGHRNYWTVCEVTSSSTTGRGMQSAKAAMIAIGTCA